MYTYQRLKDLREDKDLSQTDIAKILDTTQKQYSRWETGEYEIPFHNVIKLAKFYNVTIDFIANITNLPSTLPKKWGMKMFNLAIVADQLKNIDMQNIFAKFFIPFVILAFMIAGSKKGISYIWNLMK
jgi:transcriptional regulator with XRE-family HTH domain